MPAIGLRRDGAEPLFSERTGLVLDAYFSGTKLAWILDNVAGCARAGRGGRPRVRHRSTPGSSGSSRTADCTSPTPAMRRARCCSTSTRANGTTSCCEHSACRASVLPEVRTSSEVYGEVTTALGLESVRVGAASPAISRRRCSARCARQPGMTKNTYGTGCFMLQNTGTKAPLVAATSC